MDNNNNHKQDIKIVTLETRLEALDKKLTTFVTNDFKHLYKKVEKIEGNILWGFIIMIASTLILQVILKLYG